MLGIFIGQPDEKRIDAASLIQKYIEKAENKLIIEHIVDQIWSQYDTDNSGVIEAGEITHMLRDIYGEQFERNANAKSILRKVDSLGDTEINIDQFKEFTRQHQALLFPAFTMQFKLQKEILGKTFRVFLFWTFQKCPFSKFEKLL